MAVELAIARERCARYEELAEYRGKLLVEADERTQMLIAELAASQRTAEALARALPPRRRSRCPGNGGAACWGGSGGSIRRIRQILQ